MNYRLRFIGLLILLLLGMFALSEAATVTVDDTLSDKVVKTLAGLAALFQCIGAVIVMIIDWSERTGEAYQDETQGLHDRRK